MRAALYDTLVRPPMCCGCTRSSGPNRGRARSGSASRLSGVNPTDWKSRSGATPRPIDGFQIPHQDGAG